MTIDDVIRDVHTTLQQLLRALSNNLTAADNFGGQGKTGQVLMSQGPDAPPVWTDKENVPDSSG